MPVHAPTLPPTVYICAAHITHAHYGILHVEITLRLLV